MLSKLLARNSIFTQIVLCLVFLALFVLTQDLGNLNWEGALGLFFFFVNQVVFVLFLNNSNLINYPSYGVFFVLSWVFLFSGMAFDYKLALSFLVSTLLFWRFMLAEKSSENKKYLFDIGILLSIAGFFYPPSFLLLFFLLFVFLYKQTVNIKGFLLFVIGLSLPILVGAQILYLTDQIDWLTDYQNAFYMDYWDTPVWWLLPIGGLILFAWQDHLANLTTQDLNKKHYYFLAFVYFITWLVILALFGGDKSNLLMILGLPIAIFLSRFTQYFKKETSKEIFLWAYLAMISAYYFREEITQIYFDLLGNVTL